MRHIIDVQFESVQNMFQSIRMGTNNTGIYAMVLVLQVRIVIADKQVGNTGIAFYDFQGFGKTAKDFMLHRKAVLPEKMFDGIHQGQGVGCHSSA